MVDCCVSGLEMSWREVFPERRKTSSSSATVRAFWDFSLSCLVVGGKWMIWYKHVNSRWWPRYSDYHSS